VHHYRVQILRGDKVKYRGRDDHHDARYDSLRVYSPLFALKNQSRIMSKYTGIPVDEEYCTYSISIYKTLAYENEIRTNNPIIFACFGIVIFAFICVVFLLYDGKVQQRQVVVMDSALRSNAVVSSLFPSIVRDKILNEANINIAETDGTSTVIKDNTDLVKTPFSKRLSKGPASDENTTLFDGCDTTDNKNLLFILDSPPIADLYKETTVFFADIAGFTQWSSSRSPNDVFVLLETLYGSFDRLAHVHRIFKVETIGDSYVAVVGLPEKRKHHASAMVDFSRRVLIVLQEVLLALSTRLGCDIFNLNLRIGLNSGPTTAGVLRGEKSRFQLFGDTVNTAARMESNGFPGKIHCSESTAQCIVNDGNGSWLIKRDNLIEAKGKGLLQTYWIDCSTINTDNNEIKSSTSAGSCIIDV
jgi:class 3 adenylate cyclase